MKKHFSSKFLELKRDLKLIIFEFIHMSEIFKNILYLNKKTLLAVKEFRPFKFLMKILDIYNSDIDFSNSKEENFKFLKNVSEETKFNDENINYRDLSVFLKLFENKDNEILDFNGKYI